MSSTNRSDSRDEHISDFYVTPLNPIKDFLNKFEQVHPEFKDLQTSVILDPCAGGDDTHEMSYPKVLKLYGYENIHTMDIRDSSKADIIDNYLFNFEVKNKFDVIITNPPFNIALDIINKALSDIKDDGYVVMILRLNFFGSKSRKEFFQTNMPNYCFVHSKRISFLDNGKADSIEYGHYVWKKNEKVDYTKLYLI